MRVYKKEEQLARADIIAKQIAKQQENIRKMIDIAIKQGGLEDDVTHSHRKAYEEAADRLQKDLTDFEAVNNLPTYRSEKAARVAAAYAKKQAELEAQKEKDAGGEGEEEGAEKDAQGALNVDKGEGREADASGEAPEVEGDEDDDDEEDEEDEDDEDDEDEDDDDDDDGEFVLDESDDAVIEARYKLNSMSRAKLVETAAREGLEIYSGQPAPKRGPNKGKAPSKTSLQLINELLHEYFAPTKDYDEDAEEDSEDEVKFGGPAKKTDEYEEDSEDETTADEAGDDDDDDGDEKQTRKAKVDALDNAIAQKIEELNDINDVYYSRGTKPREGVDLKQYKPQTDKAFKELLTLIDGYILSRKIAAGEGDYDEGYTLPLPSRIPAKLTDSDLFLKAEEKYQDGMDKINAMVKDNKSSKSGKGKPLANLLANPKQQYNRMGRPVSNDDKINNEMIKMNKKWQNNNPRHENPVGSLYPFKSKTSDARYDFPTELRYERNISHPTKDARGADYSLLQGEIGGPTVNKEVKRQYKPSQRQVVTPAQALQNVLSGAGKKSGALKKLVFDDEANDMYGEGMHSRNQGFIPEDKEDHFKLPDLKKKKEKEMAAKLSGRRK